MLCVRCSHPLPPRADRCVRCFALNRLPADALAFSFDDEPVPIPNSNSGSASKPRRKPASPFLLSFAVDAVLVVALTAACAFAALQIGRVRYPFDFLRDTARLWFALAVNLALGWSLLARTLHLRPRR